MSVLLVMWHALGLPSAFFIARLMWAHRHGGIDGLPWWLRALNNGCAALISVGLMPIMAALGPLSWLAFVAAMATNGEGRFNIWTGKMLKPRA